MNTAMKLEAWIDTNYCPEHYHEFRREAEGGPLKVYHADETECSTTEFNFWPHQKRVEVGNGNTN